MKVKEYMKTYNSFSGTDMVATMYIPGVEGVEGAITLGSLQTISYSIHMERSPIRAISNINAKTYVMGPRTIAGSLVFAVFDKHFVYEAMKKLKGENSSFYFLADELPPFDITVTFANEYGHRAKLALYGVRLIDEGQVMSINDILTENTYQFVATDIDLLSDNTSSASGDLIYEGLVSDQPLTQPVSIEWEEATNTNIEETVSEYDYALRATVVKNCTEAGGNGKVEFNFYGDVPTEGKIVIYKYNEIGGVAQWIYQSTIICTPSTEYPAQYVTSQGDYKAQYFDVYEQIRSKPVEFSIIKEEKFKLFVPTPTIADCTSTEILFNLGENTQLFYYREVGKSAWITKEITNNAKQIRITKLTPATEYEFKAVYYEDYYFESEIGTVTTKQDGNRFKVYQKYLMDNPDILEEYNIDMLLISYISGIASEIHDKTKEDVPTCVAKAMVQLDLMPGPGSKSRALYDTPAVTLRDCEIIAIESTRFENRYLEVQNTHVSNVEIIDNIRGHFLVPLDTKQLIIEKSEGPKRIIALSKMKKEQNGYLYEAQLDQGLYKIYTINNSGIATSKKTFMSISNDTKKELIVRQNLINKDKSFALNLAKDDMANYIGNLKEEQDVLIMQWSVIDDLTQSDAVQPEILEIKNNTVTIAPINPVNVLPEKLYLCIEDIDKVYDCGTIRKVEVDRLTKYKTTLTIDKDCLIKGRRYCVWYQEINSRKKYRATCFVFEDNFDENDIDAVCAKKDRDILLKELSLMASRTNTTHLLDYINSVVSSVFEDSTQNLEKSINNIVETMYNENMLTKKNLCDSICLVFAARNKILSRYNNSNLSEFIVKGDLIKAKDITKTAYLKRFIIGKDGITYLDPIAISPGQGFEASFYKENNQIVGFYLIESDKEKVGLPTIMDASTHTFYGRRMIYDN